MKSLIVANWKMNPPTFKEARALFEATKKIADILKDTSIIVAPPIVFLRGLTSVYRGKKITFAVQHAHFESSGSFTGEVSLVQAQDAGASYVIVGHAERRSRGETNDDTKKKVAGAIKLGISPILCIGEMVRTHDGTHFAYIRDQILAGFADVVPAKIPRVIVAYEPVWAIGAETGMAPSGMHEMAIFIRKTIVELYGPKGMKVQILYGGAIDNTNAEAMMRNGDINGLLVGRASIDSKKFTSLAYAIKNI